MDKVVLKATKRDVIGKQVNALRRSGKSIVDGPKPTTPAA